MDPAQSFSPSLYTIGWICALSIELTAAKSMLDEKHDYREYERASNDNNTYVFGKVGSHYVVIATLPSGEYGTNSAAGVARDLVRSFTNVRVALMVGIGGGAPLIDIHKSQDIRLGDIVVSAPKDGRGGVCQYDFGKVIQDQDFQGTGHLNRPPASVLSALAVMMSDIEMEGHDIDDIIDEALKKWPRLREKYQRPSQDTDRLYKSAFKHPDQDQPCASTCSQVDKIVPRDPRPEGDQIAIHRGLIASGNSLIKDALLRDQIARELGILCFEMEAAGLMNQFPTLVIRGISDYADSHKNKEWQGYAAMTAAAFARKLLLRLPSSDIANETRLSELRLSELKEDLHNVMEQVHTIDERGIRQELIVGRQEILQWLGAPDPSINYNLACSLRHGNSGSWIFKTPSLNAWKERTLRFLWLCGLSGRGKTVLTATILEHLFRERKTEVFLYFFFDTKNGEKQRLGQALRSLIRQLSASRDSSWTHLESLYESCRSGTFQPCLADLKSCLNKMSEQESVAVIFDAVDEVPVHEGHRREVLEWIEEIRQHTSMRLLVTSRPEDDITNTLTKVLAPGAKLDINWEHTNNDIQKYVRAYIHDPNRGLSRWKDCRDVQEKIETTLMNKADGMYRWVVCQLNSLSNCLSLTALDAALRSLPEGLDETYDRILTAIPREQKLPAVRLLQLLAYSMRPLYLYEVGEAVAVNLDGSPPVDSDLVDMRALIVNCGSLTQIVKGSALSVGPTIQLAHASVKEYMQLASPQSPFGQELQEPTAHSRIVEICLAALYTRRCSNSFRAYSAHHWLKHFEATNIKGTTFWTSRLFLEEKFYQYWLTSVDVDRWRLRDSLSRNRLCVAAFFGLTGAVRDMVARGANINSICTVSKLSPLQTAVSSGQLEMTKYLCDAGAWMSNALPTQLPPLHIAIAKSHLEVAKILIESRADANITAFGKPILFAAASRGFVEVVKLLIRHGAKVNGRNLCRRTALFAAAENDRAEVVELLLAEGANTNAREINGNNALWVASAAGHIETVRILARRVADINAHGKQGTALFAAASRDRVPTVRFLLRLGAKLLAQEHRGLILVSVKQNRLEMAKFLISHWMHVNENPCDLTVALRVAARRRFLKMTKLLTESFPAFIPDINARGPRGTALTIALAKGSAAIADVLLSNGARIAARAANGNYNAALHAAARRGLMSVARFALRCGANPNSQLSNRYGTALCAASSGGHVDIVKLLIEQGAHLDANGKGLYSCALQYAAARGHVAVAQILLDNNAMTNVEPIKGQNSCGGTLQTAACRDRLEIVEMLLRKGVYVDAKKGSHTSALQAAIDNCRYDVADSLIRHGATLIADNMDKILTDVLKAGDVDRSISVVHEEMRLHEEDIRTLQQDGNVLMPSAFHPELADLPETHTPWPPKL